MGVPRGLLDLRIPREAARTFVDYTDVLNQEPIRLETRRRP